jgi:glutamate-5-semialdehyde dehydrogenase
MNVESIESEVIATLERARGAARGLALASTLAKNAALANLSSAIRAGAESIAAANARDLEHARAGGRTGAFVERLTLNPARIEAMAAGVDQVAALDDPVGKVIDRFTRPNGLIIEKVRVPIGLIAIIYESRPNVTVDAGALGFRSGNAVVLRGGSEALHSNLALADMIASSIARAGLPAQCVSIVRNPDREAIQIMKRRPDLIDLIIPRGGNSLKQALAGSSVPLLPHFDGICATYVDKDADLAMAAEICIDAKCSRPSVCNSMENMIVHRDVAREFIPTIAARMTAAGVELRGDDRARVIASTIKPVSAQDYDTEYLDLILSVKIVDSIDEAIAFIERHGSHLADSIVTRDAAAADRFMREVDSACVFHNASTRFTDGFEFGFGAETGISTNRLHARGPMGLNELTTYKYVVRGRGQVRAA